jgi:uncharacterized protein YecE (DUF72 family)
VRVGTSGWNYTEWKGSFYPDDLKPAAMLPYYAERFSTVEVNATFYRMPTPKVVAGWAAAVPPAFTFVLKAPQRITHFARLRDVDETVRVFGDVARGLGARLGPLLFQLPPNFKKDVGRLGDVLYMVPPDLRMAWEFRHESWFSDDVYERLRARNAALAIVEDEAATTPALATADWGYFRLRAVDYTDARLQAWVKTIRTVGAGWGDAFVFFKHEERGTGPALARRLETLLAT